MGAARFGESANSHETRGARANGVFALTTLELRDFRAVKLKLKLRLKAFLVAIMMVARGHFSRRF
jgi:hypothetical protein